MNVDTILSFFNGFIALIFIIGILIILLIPVPYVLLYISDILIEPIIKLIMRNVPEIKTNSFIDKLIKGFYSRDTYIRYETPFVALCISFPSFMLLISDFLDTKKDVIFGYASVALVYLMLYLIGMKIKYSCSNCRYKRVLDNNLDFLKLSFLPLGFIITMIGLFSTFIDFNILDFDRYYGNLFSVFKEMFNLGVSENGIKLFLSLSVYTLMLTVVLYIISLPLQLIAYFAISCIKYFNSYGDSYISLIKKIKSIYKYLLDEIIGDFPKKKEKTNKKSVKL